MLPSSHGRSRPTWVKSGVFLRGSSPPPCRASTSSLASPEGSTARFASPPQSLRSSSSWASLQQSIGQGLLGSSPPLPARAEARRRSGEGPGQTLGPQRTASAAATAGRAWQGLWQAPQESSAAKPSSPSVSTESLISILGTPAWDVAASPRRHRHAPEAVMERARGQARLSAAAAGPLGAHAASRVALACRLLGAADAEELRRVVTASAVAEVAYKRGEEAAWGQRYKDALPSGACDYYSVRASPPGAPQRFVVAEGEAALYVGIMGTKALEDVLVDVDGLSMMPLLDNDRLVAVLRALPADARRALPRALQSLAARDRPSQRSDSAPPPRHAPHPSDRRPSPRAVPAAHNGFAQRALAVPAEDLFREALAKDKDIVFTGHSLGGAVATLATLRLLSSLPPHLQRRVHCVGFAVPPVGNHALASLCRACGWTRCVAHYLLPEDPIPHVLQYTPFQKHGCTGPFQANKRPFVPQGAPGPSAVALVGQTGADQAAPGPAPAEPEPCAADRAGRRLSHVRRAFISAKAPERESGASAEDGVGRSVASSCDGSAAPGEGVADGPEGTAVSGGVASRARSPVSGAAAGLVAAGGVVSSVARATARAASGIAASELSRAVAAQSGQLARAVWEGAPRLTRRVAAQHGEWVRAVWEGAPEYAMMGECVRPLHWRGVRDGAGAGVADRDAEAEAEAEAAVQAVAAATAAAASPSHPPLFQPTFSQAVVRGRLMHGCRYYRLRVGALVRHALTSREESIPGTRDLEEGMIQAYVAEMRKGVRGPREEGQGAAVAVVAGEVAVAGQGGVAVAAGTVADAESSASGGASEPESERGEAQDPAGAGVGLSVGSRASVSVTVLRWWARGTRARVGRRRSASLSGLGRGERHSPGPRGDTSGHGVRERGLEGQGLPEGEGAGEGTEGADGAALAAVGPSQRGDVRRQVGSKL